MEILIVLAAWYVVGFMMEGNFARLIKNNDVDDRFDYSDAIAIVIIKGPLAIIELGISLLVMKALYK